MTEAKTNRQLSVGVAGLGTIGLQVAKALDANSIPGLCLVGVCSGSVEKAQKKVASFQHPPTVTDSENLARMCDIIVECVPKAAFLSVAKHALNNSCTLVTVSGAAILANPDIIEVARRNGARIILATGALLGLDAIRAAAEGTIHSAKMETRKPPKSLAGAPYLEENNIDVLSLKSATCVFKGTAAEGAIGFPSNVNVAAAVGLAGIGADHTSLEIWCDPLIRRNTHTISIDADSASFTMKIENVPSEKNPGTGKITALSVIAALRAETATLRVGS
jgi:aspartate dehydrogenase